MKKIAFFAASLSMGGMERVLVNYANLFSRRGWDVTVFNLTHDDEAIVSHFDPSVKYHKHFIPVKSIKRCGIKNILKLNFRLCDWHRWVATRSAEYLHSKFVTEHFDVEVAFSGFPTYKIVSGADASRTVTAGWIHGELQPDSYKPIRTYEEAAAIMGRLQKLICVSEGALSTVSKIYGRTEGLYVVHNPSDRSSILRMSQEKGCPEKERFTFINVSRFIEKHKGFLRMLSACKRLNDEGFLYDLWLVGDGVDFDMVKEAVERDHIDNVHLLGRQDNPYKFMRGADMYLCASYSEGFSMVMMEAIILALPMLTTRVPGAAEMLADGEYGLIVDNTEEGLYEGMKRILSDPSLYEHYRMKAQERKDYLSEDSVMDKLEAILEG